jgi:hypothetical protein
MNRVSSSIMEAIEKYKKDDNHVGRSQLIKKLRRKGIEIENPDHRFSDSRSIEQKVDALGTILVELLVEKWENGELTDEELADRVDPYLG